MSTKYKRVLVNIPNEDVDYFNDYSNRYNLSLSSMFIFCTKKYLEQEDIVKQFPKMVKTLESLATFEHTSKSTRSKTNKNGSKIKKQKATK